MSRKVTTIKELQKAIVAFRDARDWRQFHTPKDCALSLVLEAAEVLEHFQWKKTPEEVEVYVKSAKNEVAEELMDVLYWTLLMSYDLGINVGKSFKKKMIKNAQKYPVDKARGRATKYTKL